MKITVFVYILLFLFTLQPTLSQLIRNVMLHYVEFSLAPTNVSITACIPTQEKKCFVLIIAADRREYTILVVVTRAQTSTELCMVVFSIRDVINFMT